MTFYCEWFLFDKQCRSFKRPQTPVPPMPQTDLPAPPDDLLQALTRHYDELVDGLRRRFGDRGFAREVVHEVCLRLLERPPEQPVQTPVAFLRHISHHAAIDRWRNDASRQALIDNQAEPPEAATTRTTLSAPELAVAWRQRQVRLLDTIRALPERSREVFILTQLYHLPQAEVAGHLDISRGMVARHLARALEDVLPLLLAQD